MLSYSSVYTVMHGPFLKRTSRRFERSRRCASQASCRHHDAPLNSIKMLTHHRLRMASELPTGFTCPYRDIHGLKVELDLYLPPTNQEHSGRLLPSLVYFHGGGLTVGEKTSWFPFWVYGLSLFNTLLFYSSIPNR